MTHQQEIKLEAYLDRENAEARREGMQNMLDSLEEQARRQDSPRFIMRPDGIHRVDRKGNPQPAAKIN